MNGRREAGELEGRVRDLTHGGDAVIETGRGIVMARGALPGERVSLRLERSRSGVLRGTVLALLEPNPERVPPSCPVVARCGGCPMMPLSYAAQARFKRERLARVLAEHGAPEPEFVPGLSQLAYRVRARLAWQRNRAGLALGYRAAGSAFVVDAPECAVLSPPLARGFAELRRALAAQLQGRGEVALGIGAGEGCTLDLGSEQPQPPEVYAACERLAARPGISGVALRIGQSEERGQRLAAAEWGDPRQHVRAADGLDLLAPGGSFTQANREVNAVLVSRVGLLAEPVGARVLELYAGYGNLTVALARGALELRAVEAQREAAAACEHNLRARGFDHARVVCADAARGAAGRGPLDVVVLDPPRSGAREVLPVLIERRPSRIVYVSCDLASLRRDLGSLRQAGYRVDAAVALDMFPQTAHLESVVRLQKLRYQAGETPAGRDQA
jgi:23S rRNA (uracil1939-C5)-methyltransferase